VQSSPPEVHRGRVYERHPAYGSPCSTPAQR
jgi:hypothetical protein